MDKHITDFQFLKPVRFADFQDWNIQEYFSNNTLSDKNYVLIGSFVRHKTTSVSKKKAKEKGISIISKISFGGKLFLRDKEEIESYKGNLFLVKPNQFIFSKIRARNGCIYFHSENFEFAVSSEYPTLEYDENKVNAEYLKMVLRSQYFKNILEAKSTGGAKARMTVKELSMIKIPLPSLAEQTDIVAAYQAAHAEADRLAAEAAAVEKEIETYINTALGIEIKTAEVKKGLQVVQFKELTRWSLDYLFGNEILKGNKYPTNKISDLCKIGSGGTPSRTKLEYFVNGEILWVKTGEVREEIIYDTEEKITSKALLNSSAKIYPAGSLIVAMYGATAGRSAKLGADASTNQACAVLHQIDNENILTDYLWIYIQNEINNFKDIASGSAQPNLNAEKIGSYEIPLPPLAIQSEIVAQVSAMRSKAKQKKAAAVAHKAAAIAAFEQAIFDIKEE